jgi:hypothetical protein
MAYRITARDTPFHLGTGIDQPASYRKRVRARTRGPAARAIHSHAHSCCRAFRRTTDRFVLIIFRGWKHGGKGKCGLAASGARGKNPRGAYMRGLKTPGLNEAAGVKDVHETPYSLSDLTP